jgi:hypothetical protein
VRELERLRRAQRDLEPERVIDALDRALHAWRAPGSLWRARLAREHPVYSAEGVDLGVAVGLERWTGECLSSLRAREVPESSAPPGVSAVWLAGSIPPSAFAAILLPLVAGSAVYAKPSSSDPVSPRLFAESLRAVDAGVARAVAIGDDARALEQADAVIAHGSDETLREIRARVPVHAPFVAYGHKLSAAAVGRDADLPSAAQQLALDVALYDGRGCLSPAYAFVEDVPRGRAEAFAEQLAEALERAARELPRGALDLTEQAQLRDLRAGLAAREDTKLWTSSGSLAWTVAVSEFSDAPPVPGQLRTVPVVPVRDLEGLKAWCNGLAPHLSTLGRSGWAERDAELAPMVLRAGGSRLCPLGRMQLPPIDWHHDGVAPIRPLLRCLDLEDEGVPGPE